MVNMTAARAKALKKPGRYCAGGGLYLRVRATKVWVQRLTVNGVRRDITIGPFDLVPLAEARMVALPEPPRPVGREGPHRGAPPRGRPHASGSGGADACGAEGELARGRIREGVGADARSVRLPCARSDACGCDPGG